MTIGQVAKMVGVPAKTIRFYEEINLLKSPKRSTNNYRQYDQKDVDILFLIKESRTLGLSTSEIKNIVDLCSRNECKHIDDYLKEHIPIYKKSIQTQIEKLISLKDKFDTLEKDLNDIKNENSECSIFCNTNNRCL